MSYQRLQIAFFSCLTLVFSIFSGCKKKDPSELASEEPERTVITDQSIRFLYNSNETGKQEVWGIINGNKIQLTSSNVYDTWWPRVSPDLQHFIAYRSAASSDEFDFENAELWRFNIDGTNPVLLIAAGANSWAAQGHADYSPVGNQLVMAAISPTDNRWHLYTTDVDGGNPMQITSRTGMFVDPTWSPDGTLITYSAFPDDYTGSDLKFLEIHTCNADGSNETRLTNDQKRDNHPIYTGDWQEIIFETEEDPLFQQVGKWSLRAIQPDGNNLRTVFYDSNLAQRPQWTSDTRIYFTRLTFFDQTYHLARINTIGEALELLTDGNASRASNICVY